MSDTSEIIKQRVRLFFGRFSWKNCLTFFVFLFLAIIFWGMQIIREKFEYSIAIPIKYIHIPDSLTFENELPSNITAIIKDDGANIASYFLAKRNDTIIIDVKEAINSKRSIEKLSIPNEKIDQLIREKLFSSTDLRSYSPSYILEPFAVMQRKNVSVVYDGYIELPQGYIIDGDVNISPEKVIAYGSKQMLDTIFFAHTKNETIQNLKESTTINVSLQKLKGIRFSPNNIKLTVPIDKFTVEKINVPISCINLPEDLTIKFFPMQVSVSFIVGLKQFKNINLNDFNIVLDYNELKKQQSSQITVEMTNYPDYVRIQSIDPAEIEFILEKK